MRGMYTTPDSGKLMGGSNEVLELVKAWVGTSLAFAIMLLGGQIFSSFFLEVLFIAAITCGIGFVLHELAHRVVARYFGAEAHFVAEDMWLIISIVIAFGGFFLAAPGAVWHTGVRTRQQSGLIALAGPVTNLVLALLFLALYPLAGYQGFWLMLVSTGYHINAWLGLFNMIPVGMIDGKKVLDWNPVVFGVTAAIAVVLVFMVPDFVARYGWFL